MEKTTLSPLSEDVKLYVSGLGGSALESSASADMYAQALSRQADLLKPLGALGELENLAVLIASWRHEVCPTLDNRQALVFAGNHGIISSYPNLSAFPSNVTHQMVENFHNQTAAINQLCNLNDVKLVVHSFDLSKPTQDFSKNLALSGSQLIDSLSVGASLVSENLDILCLGEMGIGNTTSAAAMSYALCRDSIPSKADDWCGAGTGISSEDLTTKCRIIEKAVLFHEDNIFVCPPQEKAWYVLQAFGGFEFAALVGAMLRSRALRIPTIVDGFAGSVAAAVIFSIDPRISEHLIFSHLSQEKGHKLLLKYLNRRALLDRKMRLGEASGALVALGIVDTALACHNNMGTFSSTNTSGSHN